MLCQCQASPVPLIRYVIPILGEMVQTNLIRLLKDFHLMAAHVKLLGKLIQNCSHLCIYDIFDIRAFNIKDFTPSQYLFAEIEKTKHTFLFSLIEPLGSKAPAFSSDSKISMFVRKTSESFALLCEPQAFPVALIRYVECDNMYQVSRFDI